MEQDHAGNLKKARETLLKMRRDWAAAIAAGYVKGKTEDDAAKFWEVQNAIEAIDRAIEDEEPAQGSVFNQA